MAQSVLNSEWDAIFSSVNLISEFHLDGVVKKSGCTFFAGFCQFLTAGAIVTEMHLSDYTNPPEQKNAQHLEIARHALCAMPAATNLRFRGPVSIFRF